MTFKNARRLSEGLTCAVDDLEAVLSTDWPPITVDMHDWVAWTPRDKADTPNPGLTLQSGVCTTCLAGAVMIREHDALEMLARNVNEENTADETARFPGSPDPYPHAVSVTPRELKDDVLDKRLGSIETARQGLWLDAIDAGSWETPDDTEPRVLMEALDRIAPPSPMPMTDESGLMDRDRARRLIADLRTRVIPELKAIGL